MFSDTEEGCAEIDKFFLRAGFFIARKNPFPEQDHIKKTDAWILDLSEIRKPHIEKMIHENLLYPFFLFYRKGDIPIDTVFQ